MSEDSDRAGLEAFLKEYAARTETQPALLQEMELIPMGHLVRALEYLAMAQDTCESGVISDLCEEAADTIRKALKAAGA